MTKTPLRWTREALAALFAAYGNETVTVRALSGIHGVSEAHMANLLRRAARQCKHLPPGHGTTKQLAMMAGMIAAKRSRGHV